MADPRTTARNLPSFIDRLGCHQLSVTLTPKDAETLERLRAKRGDRSWNETITAALRKLARTP